MKKVNCEGCGLVNLEKFTTFPYCAACGRHLPEKPVPRWKQLLMHPVRPIYWAGMVGTSAVALAVAAASLIVETKDRESGRLLIYSQLPTQAAPNGFVYGRFSLDSSEPDAPDNFELVRLRLPNEMLHNFDLVEISPRPQSSETAGTGRYLTWNNLKRETPLILTFTPRRLGVHRWRVSIYAEHYMPFEARGTIDISGDNALKRGFNSKPVKLKPLPTLPASPFPSPGATFTPTPRDDSSPFSFASQQIKPGGQPISEVRTWQVIQETKTALLLKQHARRWPAPPSTYPNSTSRATMATSS